MPERGFSVTIPVVDPTVCWRIHKSHRQPDGKEKHAVRMVGTDSDLVAIIGPKRHAEALVGAYNEKVERAREEAWADHRDGPWCLTCQDAGCAECQ